jgi:hypothetical protein
LYFLREGVTKKILSWLILVSSPDLSASAWTCLFAKFFTTSTLSGVGLDMAIRKILYNINIALRCNKELASLKDLVMSIQPILTQIQQYRLELNTKKGISTFQIDNKAAAVSEWLKKLDGPLQQAAAVSAHYQGGALFLVIKRAKRSPV